MQSAIIPNIPIHENLLHIFLLEWTQQPLCSAAPIVLKGVGPGQGHSLIEMRDLIHNMLSSSYLCMGLRKY